MGAMFVIGAISGAGLSAFCHPFPFSPPNRDDIQKHLTFFLTSRLSLTPEQQEKIKPIVSDFAQEVEVLHDQSANQMKQFADTTDGRIAEVLTPYQKVIFDKLRRERDQHIWKHGGPPPP